MRQRKFLGVIGVVASSPLVARAQQPAMPVIAFLSSGSRNLDASRLTAFYQGLNEAGYVEGRNVAIELARRRVTSIGCRPSRPISCTDQ
jgi:putative ABC transport system substrate-binding protein